MTPPRARAAAWVILVIAGLYVFWDAGRPFNSTDEFWYLGIVQQMLASGDYLTPRFGPDRYFGNPPLVFWINAPLVALVDNAQVAVRIVPGLSFLAMLWLVYRIAARRLSPGRGLLAMAIFFLCYDHLYLHGYKNGVIDGLLHLELALIFWLNLRLEAHPGRLRAIGALIGLTFMTKTAFAIIPLLITGLNVWRLWPQRRIRPRQVLEAGLIAACIGLPWFIAIAVVHGPRAIEGTIGVHLWHRALGHREVARQLGEMFGRSESLYVLRHYLTYGQPWSLLVWPALLALGERWRTLDASRQRLLGLAAGWFLFVMATFLIARGRWSWYISSAYAPAAILIAWWLGEMLDGTLRHHLPILLALTACAFAPMPVVYLHNPFPSTPGRSPLDAVALAHHLFAACGLLGLMEWLWQRRERLPDAREARTWEAGALVAVAAGLAAATVSAALILAGWPAVLQRAHLAPLPVAAIVLALGVFRVSARTLVVAATAGSLILGVGYLAAPLRYVAAEHRRPEVRWMERLISRGAFENGKAVNLTNLTYYSYVVMRQSYAPAFEFTYDPRTWALTIRKAAP